MTNAQPQETVVHWRASLRRILSLKTLRPGGGLNTRVSAGAERGNEAEATASSACFLILLSGG